MNHIVSAIALYDAGLNASTTAAELRMHVELLPIIESQRMADQLNDAPRIQKIVVAKLMVEYIGAVEELGALCESIRYRSKAGIFSRFIESSVGQVAAFYQ
jgi:hypothetical protein